MKNDKFKLKIIDIGIRLNGLFCGYDIVINKKLEINMRLRKVATKPNIKPGEVVIIKSIDINLIAQQITKDAIQTVLALHDILPDDDISLRIKQHEEQIKHQIEIIKYNIIAELIKDITPIKQTQIYYSLGAKNADKLVSGDDTSPIYN